jgi:multisubunit Na+/H+ antiporter MnhB subunit
MVMFATTTDARPARTRMSLPKALLHIEGLAAFAAAIALYAYQGYSWWLFALLLLAPDVAMVGYLVNTRIGAIAYNLAHTYALPVLLGVLSLLADQTLGMQLALIWLAHIAMDRAVGYGFKYATSFHDTHFGRV